ncbi:hypothetical protein DBZ36_10160 [Alginatibacterium sediminis]|uniref:VOC domain-containing protein n=1 Tax=Alginatibacterium sediminis TaxID=2164068 RepID=A0A420EDK5_9ALTE|nr:VOC family protein [Alginatibacterium sediminis]RKF18750.1 hypothetical protein DBZ36_10160 [Alginatibacterium sediminis]
MKILPNICSSDLQASKRFYVELLNLDVKFESDWYVQLCSAENSEIELGIIDRYHDLVPLEYQQQPTGMYLTFVVNDVNTSFQRAQEMGVPLVSEPRNEFYGQRRFLCKDPDNCLVDICSPWQP